MKIVLHSRTKRALLAQKYLSKQLGQFDAYERFQAILFLEYQDCEFVASILGYSSKTISGWIKRLITSGPQGLWTKRRTGRPPRLTNKDKALLKQWIQQSPQDFGFCEAYWTSLMLQQVLEQHTGVHYAQGYICALLRGLGCSWYKQGTVPHKADLAQQQYWCTHTLPHLKAKAIKENAVILYQDEVSFEQTTAGSYGWGSRKKPQLKRICRGRSIRKVMGCIELGNGKLTWHILPKTTKEKKHTHRDFLRFLKRLVGIYSGRKVYLICDNGPIHHGPALREWLPLHQQEIELVFLPAYSPKLNPIERLWKEIKRRYFHGQLIRTEAALIKQIRRGLHYFQENRDRVQSLMNSEILIKPNFQSLTAS